MKDLGIKVVCLNSRVRKLERKLDLTPIVFQPKFSSGYENLLVNQVIQLNTRVVRLEKNIDQETAIQTFFRNICSTKNFQVTPDRLNVV